MCVDSQTTEAAFAVLRTIFQPVAAMSTLMNGLIRLKKQNGRYAAVAMPSEADCAIAQVFHGTSTEVTVLESSMVRDKSRDSRPFSR